jgi:hypothetical protein
MIQFWSIKHEGSVLEKTFRNGSLALKRGKKTSLSGGLWLKCFHSNAEISFAFFTLIHS